MISSCFSQGNYGNRAQYDKRLLVDAILYITKTGCQWRQLPNNFPPWQTVYSFFRRAKEKNIWEKVLHQLVESSRLDMGKSKHPTYAIIDSQSVKTTGASDYIAAIELGVAEVLLLATEGKLRYRSDVEHGVEYTEFELAMLQLEKD